MKYVVCCGIAILIAMSSFAIIKTEEKVHALECAAHIKSYVPAGYEWPCEKAP